MMPAPSNEENRCGGSLPHERRPDRARHARPKAVSGPGQAKQEARDRQVSRVLQMLDDEDQPRLEGIVPEADES